MARPSRSTLLGWPLLVMTLGLACVALVVLEVGRSVRGNREVADRARVGYARFALWSYREHLAETMRNAAREALGAVNHGEALHVSPRIPPAAELGHYLPYSAHCECHRPRFGPLPLAFYGFTIGADTVGVGPNFAPAPDAGWLADPVAGMPLPEAGRFRLASAEGRWLSGLLTAEARDGFSTWGYRYAIADWEGRPRFFALTLMPTARGDTILYAAEYRAAAIDSLLGAVLDDPALLPLALDARTPPRGFNRQALALEVSGPGGQRLFSWSPPAEWPTPPSRMPPSYGGLTIQAAILPQMLDKLVIGGLPADNTPILLGLLALAAGLTVVAGVQLRRELRFARARSDFVASVSHELRTPLTQIRLLLDTVRLPAREGRPVAAAELGMVDREVLRLQQLVDRVLHFRRTEEGAAAMPRVVVALGQEVAAIVEEFRPLATVRGLGIATRLGDGPRVALEPDGLRQMLLNLLDNAVKYAPDSGTIAVAVEAEGGTARLIVEDRGPGVPAEERERIFEGYARGSAATARAVGGSGIGLTVVRAIAERHGGGVCVEAPPEGGARFVVSLPGAT